HTISKRDWSSDVCSSDLEAIEAIDSETDRMQLLIEQMLELAKNRHKTTFKRTKVDIVKLCQGIQKTFTEASTRNIILKYRSEEQIGRASCREGDYIRW